MRIAPFGLTLALLIGCPGPGGSDAGPRVDGSGSDGATGQDSDGDFVCDDTEERRGSDPRSPDTDEDGYDDFVEIVFGYDPTDPTDPGRDVVFTMRETREASLQVQAERVVNGDGEDFVGAFEALEAMDLMSLTAADYYTESVALFADPMDNVAVLDADAEAFRGTVGRTRLGWEIRFEFGDHLPRDCARAYPFRYTVKRNDGTVVGLQRYLLVILPVGDTLATAAWCVPDRAVCL